MTKPFYHFKKLFCHLFCLFIEKIAIFEQKYFKFMQRKIFTKVSFNQDDFKYHFVFWVCLYSLHWLNFAYTFKNPSEEYMKIAMYTTNLTILSTWILAYLNTYLVLPNTVGNERIPFFQSLVLYFLIASGLAIASSFLFEYLHHFDSFFDHNIKALENIRRDEKGNIMSSDAINFDWKRNIPEAIFNMFLLTGLVYIRKWFHNYEIIRMEKDLLAKEKEALEYQQSAQDYKLKSLNQQIRPHFLFNALNHIYLKSLQNPTSVPEIVEKLSDALDYITYKGIKEKVLLSDEIAFIKDFIDIELQGLDKKSYLLEIEIDQNFDKTLKISPMILLTLVENGVKYGIKKTDKNKFLKIKIKVKNENELVFSMKNSQSTENDGIEIETAKGVGIKNMRERLKTFYTNKHELELNSKNDIFESKLKIQLS